MPAGDDRDEVYMRMALREAEAALDHDDVPVGCVIVHEQRIIARGRNQRELVQDPTAHAEVLAITAAAAALGSWRLHGCTLYVTLEPCCMCAGAAVLARIDTIVFGASDPKGGACGGAINLLTSPAVHHRPALRGGVLAEACGGLLTAFFRARRAAGEK